jgi:DNA-binding transcriptional ArsR family regulator
MGTDFASVARLLANPARSTVVDALLAGRPLSAGELARLAGVRPSTISEHLASLVDGGLLTVVSAGRHRYYTLSGPEVAHALEALAQICPSTQVKSLRESVGARSLRVARTCYDHVAGALGVAMLDAMVRKQWLDEDCRLAPGGARGLDEFGVDVSACQAARRQFARPCLDWTQRRMHLAGALGAALNERLNERGWVRPVRPGRGLRITDDGAIGLRDWFDLDVAALTG